jgi:hypothetical protein
MRRSRSWNGWRAERWRSIAANVVISGMLAKRGLGCAMAHPRIDLPGGQITPQLGQALAAKIIRFFRSRECAYVGPSHPARGADRASSRNAGWGCGGRVSVGAQGSRRAVLSQVSRPVSEVRRAGRTTPTRTAKACGPGTRCWCQAFAEDASGRPDIDASPISARRRRQEGIRLRGERAISRQTTAQGRPGCFRLRLWFSPCALLAQCSAQGPWVPAGTRSSLRPRLSEGEECEQTSGASRRENAGSYPLSTIRLRRNF